MVLRERRRTSGGWWPFGNLKGQRVLGERTKKAFVSRGVSKQVEMSQQD